MEPLIVSKERMILLGAGFFGDPFSLSGEWTEENEIGRLWKRFMKYFSENKEVFSLFKDRDVAYEVHIENDETKTKGHLEIFVGMELDKPYNKTLDKIPHDLLVKILPASMYAVFTLKGEEIVGDWPMKIYSEWLPGSEYELAHNFGFQYYDKRFKGMERVGESELDVYVPIKKKDGLTSGE